MPVIDNNDETADISGPIFNPIDNNDGTVTINLDPTIGYDAGDSTVVLFDDSSREFAFGKLRNMFEFGRLR